MPKAQVGRPSLETVISVITNPEYQKHYGLLASFMARARDVRRDSAKLLSLQVEMASELIALQESQRQFEKKIGESTTPDESKSLAEAATTCKSLSGAIRQIADGIAWRSLAHDRVAIHQLALKPQTGHMLLETAIEEVHEAAAHVEATGEIVLLNDLTNFVRYGDFTSVAEGTISIHEVKAGAGSARSGRSKRQKKRREQVIDLYDSARRGQSWGSKG